MAGRGSGPRGGYAGGRVRLGFIAALLLGLVGGTWILQGLNVLGGSPMTGDVFWAQAGFALVLVALGLAGLIWRRQRR